MLTEKVDVAKNHLSDVRILTDEACRRNDAAFILVVWVISITVLFPLIWGAVSILILVLRHNPLL